MHKILENSNLYTNFTTRFRQLRTPFGPVGLLIAINSRLELVPAFVTDRVARSSEISSRIIPDRAKYRSMISIQTFLAHTHGVPRRNLAQGGFSLRYKDIACASTIAVKLYFTPEQWAEGSR